jgi:bacillithiol biosynthesis cysteine-adding enzyme BshC
MSERSAAVIDYGAFQQPPSPLFRDYLSGAPQIRPFFLGGRWEERTLVEAAERSVAAEHPRTAVAQALARQQRERGAMRAAERALCLEQPHAAAVVTGQQAVLFGGPLYVLYKALAALELAQALERARNAPVVPVFWVASDDHDFAEVRSTTVLDEAGRLRSLRLNPRQEPVGKPASHVVLDDAVSELLEETAGVLPASLHRDWLRERLGNCYAPGVTLSHAFARLLSQLLPELVVLDPSDPELKRLMAPLMLREVLEASPTSRLAKGVGEELRAAGYHQQVPVREGFLNLFLFYDNERRALAHAAEGLIEVRGVSRKLTKDEAARLIEREPHAFSPGVLLRPLAQDALLPTAAYVGGPAEIAYHAQIGPSYAHFGIARPLLIPRPSLTLVEPAQGRALETEGLSLQDLEGDPEALLLRFTRDAYPEVEDAFSRAREALTRELGLVEERLAALDPTLGPAADSARGRALHQIETLYEKATRALKKRDQTRGERLRRTRDALFPGGSFQERGLGLIGPLARHGPGVIDFIRERMDVWAKGHQVLYL